MNTVICANTVPAPWRIAVLNQSEPTLAWIFFPVAPRVAPLAYPNLLGKKGYVVVVVVVVVVAPRVAPQIRPSDAFLCGFTLSIICFPPNSSVSILSMMLILAL